LFAAMFAASFGGVAVSQAEPVAGDLGSYIYSEPSDETRAEILDLMNHQEDVSQVFLQGLSLGLPIDELLQASVRNDVDNGKGYLNSANGLLPLVGFSPNEAFGSYSLSDISAPSATAVIDRFFATDERVSERPDWQVGEYHLMVPVSELKALSNKYNDGNYWYVSDDASQIASAARPVFIQLYTEHDYAIINDVDKINRLMASNPSAELPVVFVFNDVLERPISQMTQPATVANIVEDYRQYGLMVTPPPEWSLREYHSMVSIQSLEDYFGLPVSQDMPTEKWDALVSTVKNSGVHDSLIVTVLEGGNSSSDKSAVLNRADLVSAAKYLGYTEVPVSYFYIDERRVAPYRGGYRGLSYAGVQAGLPSNIIPTPSGVVPPVAGNGGINTPRVPTPPPVVEEPPTEPPTCASPPCTE